MSYKTVSLPSQLVKELEDLALRLNMGYASAAEIVKDAMRDKIAEFRKMLEKRERMPEQAESEGVA